MKALDRLLQFWRVAKARPFIPFGARVLDIGCGDGALFRLLGNRVQDGIGLDPTLTSPVQGEHFKLIPGRFPEALAGTEPFNVITLLAVLEHIPEPQQLLMAENCSHLLKPGGVLIITTPSPLVDRILDMLLWLRLIDGMELMEHYGFDPRQTPAIFSVPGLSLVKSATFQCRLNYIFVFQKVHDC